MEMVIGGMNRARKSNELIILKYRKSVIVRVMVLKAEKKKSK